jgi:hypothetical protein
VRTARAILIDQQGGVRPRHVQGPAARPGDPRSRPAGDNNVGVPDQAEGPLAPSERRRPVGGVQQLHPVVRPACHRPSPSSLGLACPRSRPAARAGRAVSGVDSQMGCVACQGKSGRVIRPRVQAACGSLPPASAHVSRRAAPLSELLSCWTVVLCPGSIIR